jgi:hypothetical protein
MPDIIITPSSGLIDFFPVSTRVGRIEGSGNTINVLNPSGYVAVSGSGMSINTSAPNALLHAYSSISGATILNLEGTNGSLFSVVDNLSGSLMSVNNNAGLPVFEVFSDDRVVAGRFGQNDFIMTSGGNIGIGTGVPSSKFHVVGTSTFNGDVSSTGSFIGGSGTAALPSFEFINDPDTGLFSPATNTFGVSTSGVERLRIDNIGRIGIGTNSPTSTLHVVGSGLFASGLISNLSSNFYLNSSFNNTFSINYGTSASAYGTINIVPSGFNPGTTNIVSQINGTNTIYLPSSNGNLSLISDINTSQITGVLSVAKGGTNTSTYSNGQLLIGSGTSLVANTLSAGTGIAITNGSGTINIATTGLANYDTSVFNLGAISGTNAINCGQDRQIQTLTLNGVATTFTTGTGWPSSNSVARETTLNIFASGNTSITWTIVNDWYRQPDSPLPSGRHIVLLRSVGSGTMQGHYIGNKTN